MRAPRELSRRHRPYAYGRLTLEPRPGAQRRAFLGLVGAAALAFGVAALIGQAAGYGRLLHSFRSADVRWLALCLPAEAVAHAGYALAFRGAAALDLGPRLSFWGSVRAGLASLGAARLMLAGGPAYLYWVLHRHGLGKAGAVARLVALNALLFGFLGAAAWLASLLVLVGPAGNVPRGLALPWLIGGAAAVGGLLAAVLLFRVGLPTGRVADVSRILLGQPAGLLPAYGGALLYWLGDVLCLWFGLRAFDARPAAAALVLAYATSYLATTLPLPLGGAGGGEAAMTLALTAVGVPLASALLAVLAYRLFSYWMPTLPAVALLATESRLGQKRAQSAETGMQAAKNVHAR